MNYSNYRLNILEACNRFMHAETKISAQGPLIVSFSGLSDSDDIRYFPGQFLDLMVHGGKHALFATIGTHVDTLNPPK